MRQKLLKWFAANARDLPWRRDHSAYRVWVSEIMCQQTQVATVLPYFERFLEAYPTIANLAAADEAELMRMWEGLGYYRRARSLHAAAQKIVAEHDGNFPTSFDDVLALPGIGRYTAGAILSISRNEAFPILEGNTQRVFSRWIGLNVPPTERESQARLWEFSELMLPRRSADDRTRGPAGFNQAAMELGALVCSPRNPKCDECPVASLCHANLFGLQDEIPGKISKVQYESRTEIAAVFRVDDKVLVRTLPKGVRFAGMVDFPREGPPVASDLAGMESWLAVQLGVEVQLGMKLKTIKHAVTRYRMTLQVHAAHLGVGQMDAGEAAASTVASSIALPEGWQWATLDELEAMPMSVTGRKIVGLLKDAQPSLFG
ncbi:A/G-specific adenine glycosylase [Rhodopirellula halodulae]|uniref:A/G-specific adenine glycosylase n=1 Tax=Rhodopirellula halodulae TaxID=2894198 RepID=UPI003F683BF9